LCRKAIKEILMKGKKEISVTPKNLGKYAGIQKFRFGEIEEENRIGVVNGLAYTESGGDLLSIEAVTMPGKDGKVTMTGNLKDVMKESIRVAEMLIKSRAATYGLDYESAEGKTNSRARAGRRDAERWSFGRCGDGDGDHVGAHGY
jgi:ATP-dependent Lon protease